jgi:hypothetical protein
MAIELDAMTEDELRAWRAGLRVGSRVARGSGYTFWIGTVIAGPLTYDHWWAKDTRYWTVAFDIPDAETGEADILRLPDDLLYPLPYPGARDSVSLNPPKQRRRRSRPTSRAQA